MRDLEPDEKRLHESLHPDVARVLSGKGLLLLKRMLEESGYADSELFSDVCSGFEVPVWQRTLMFSEMIFGCLHWLSLTCYLQLSGQDALPSEQLALLGTQTLIFKFGVKPKRTCRGAGVAYSFWTMLPRRVEN